MLNHKHDFTEWVLKYVSRGGDGAWTEYRFCKDKLCGHTQLRTPRKKKEVKTKKYGLPSWRSHEWSKDGDLE